MKLYGSVSLSGWAVIALALAIPHKGRADLLVFSNPDAPLPATSGNGLLGDYYRPTGGFEPGTIANANTYIAGNSADATFISTGINYAAGSVYGSGNAVSDSTPVSTYLGSDAVSLTALSGSPSGETTTQVLGNPLDGTMYVFTGYLAITAAEVNTPQTFFVGSDDGSALSIQGQQVVANNGDHSFGFTTGNNTAEFTEPGLYAIRFLYYEDGGASGVEFGSTLAGTGTFGTELTATDFYQSAPISTVPEPDSILLMATIGVIVCGLFWKTSGRRAIRT
jgi:PA14 domain